jgi:hypothetical protein
VCTYAGQIIMGGCLQIKMAPWKRVAITRIFALGPALLVALTTVENSKLFNNINEYLNILQSVQLPFAMLPVLHFAGSTRLLGRFASGPVLYAVTLLLAGLVMVSSDVLATVLTLHPSPFTLHPSPFTLHPSPFTRHPSPFTRHPSPLTLHPSPFTLHPSPSPSPTPTPSPR